MNCQDFAELLVELARGRADDGGARERGLAHADSCARCAARLAAERALSAGLRAAAHAEASAPPRVEAALLAAFRARHAAAHGSDHAPTHAAPLTLVSTQAPAAHAAAEAQHATSQVSQTAVSASNVRSFEDASARGASRAQVEAPRARSSTNWWLRVAAALLLTATAGMTASLVWKSEQHGDARLASADQGRDAGSEQSSAVVTAESRPAVAPASSPAVLSNAADVSGAATSYRNAAMPDATAGEDDPRADDEATPFAEPRRLPAPTRTAHARTRGANRLSRSALGALVANSRSDTGAETEITTDYFPLSDASALPAMEGGHVVRVELPRAALLSFGLPVNAEQTSGRVKADVLIGHDGLARAIRFVH